MAESSRRAKSTTKKAAKKPAKSTTTIKGFTDEHKVYMITIKQGEIKDSGSPFKEMTDKERQVWQDLVDHAYDQFLAAFLEKRARLG